MKIQLVNIARENLDSQMMIREWRNNPKTAQFFILQHISEKTHLDWIARQKEGVTDQAFFIEQDGVKVGCTYVRRIDRQNGTAENGIFLNPDLEHDIGIGAVASYMLLDYVYNTLQLRKINIEVLASNPAALQMNKMFGFVEEGRLRKNLYKDGEYVDVCLLGMFAEEWETQKQKIAKLFKNYL